MNAILDPSGEKLPENPQSVSIGFSRPPSGEISKSVLTLGNAPLARAEAKRIFLPSGVQPTTASSALWKVSWRGLPPAAGTTNTS